MYYRKTGRGPKISQEIRQLIISQAIHDSKMMPRRVLAIRLKEMIKSLGEPTPTEDTLMRMISDARNKQPSEFEKPWCIGACDYYNIPHDMIPILIKMQRLKLENAGVEEDTPNVLTVREARWIARLYHVAEPLIRDLFGTDENSLLWLDFIASSYVRRERVSEQMKEQYPNTADLDRLYFYSDNFLSDEVLISWWDTLLPGHKKAIVDSLEKERITLNEDIERHKKRPLSPEELKMIAECFDALKQGGLVTLREFISKSPLAQENGMIHLMTAVLYEKAMSGDIK